MCLRADFENIVSTALKDCPPGAVLLASVSGGADSVAMLAALAALKERGAMSHPHFKLRCIHIEHGIRPAAESRGDAEFVQSLCKQFGIPCRVVSIEPGRIAAVAKKKGIGIEAAARLFRRRAWFRALRRIDEHASHSPMRQSRTPAPHSLILTAHTADDMLETALMRIFRGSGPAGLASMPARRGHILRPLITLSRRDVLDYLAEKKLTWREDSTNADTQFLRNRIRRQLIPQLDTQFPQWRGTIASLAETQSLTAHFIEDEARNRIQWKMGSESLSTDAGNFFAQPAIIREEALYQGVNLLKSPVKIKRANIRRFADGKAPVVDLGALEMRNTAGQVVISAKGDSFSSAHSSEFGFSLLIYAPGSYILNNRVIVDVYAIETAISASDQPEESGVFFTSLPAVVRMENGVVELKPMPAAIDEKRYAVRITPEKGRVDIERSE